MKQNKVITLFFLLLVPLFLFAQKNETDDNRFVTYLVDAKKQEIKLYWQDDKKNNFKSIQQLKLWLEQHHRQLLFAMNAGMYRTDYTPSGLFIENGKVIHRLNKASGGGNFYLKPNGVFYITTDDVPSVCNTTNFINNGKIKYATQSGPMLVIDGQINAAFKVGSANLNIRNGVGVLPNNTIIFAMSKSGISLYDFANYFKKLGCKNALYLDGFVSRTYLPEKKWIQLDGNFGVIIGATTVMK